MQIQTKTAERIQYFDIAKGILIILMVYGHVFLSGPIRHYIYSFHMPAFFIISGILLSYSTILQKPFTAVMQSRAVGLLVPLVFFELFGILTEILRFGFEQNLFGFAFNTLSLNLNNGPSWFLWDLFVAEIIFLGLKRICDKDWPVFVLTFSLGLALTLSNNVFPLAHSTGTGLMFLTFGFYAKEFFAKKQSAAYIFFAAVISVVSCFMNDEIDPFGSDFGNSVFLFVLAAISGTVLVLQLGMRISSDILAYFGKNTLIILGTHNLFILPTGTYLGIEEFSGFVGYAVFIIIIAVEVLLIRIFNSAFPLFTGKKKPQNTLEHVLCFPGYAMFPLVLVVQVLIHFGYF